MDPKITPLHRPNALRWRDRPSLVEGDTKTPRPRGRHAKPSTSGDALPSDALPVDGAPRPVPVHQRLGYRPAEFAALLGISYVTVWRRIKRGEITVVRIGGVQLVPRAFAIEQGLISDSA